MSVDTTFKPISPTYLVGVTALQPGDAKQMGVTSWRIANTNAAANHVSWGATGSVAAVAPIAGTPSANTILIPIGGVSYIEAPAGSFFIAALASVEITGGQGGIGG